MKHIRSAGPLRRVGALLLAGTVLWGAAVTAGSESVSAAVDALADASPLGALRWELGDLWVHDGLSPATALALGESPLLRAARPHIATLRAKAPAPVQPSKEPAAPQPKPEKAPSPPAADNGVTARTLTPKGPSGYTVCGRAYITNSTKHTLDPAALQTPFAAQLGQEAPQLLIIHTHGSEAYTPVPGTAEVPWTGDHRSKDTRYNVVGIGDVMAEVFSDAGISVLHDRNLYDYPNYKGSYERSLAAIQQHLKEHPSIRFILDIHRDAIADAQGKHYKVVSKIEGRGTSSQMTLVVGSDGSGKPHPHWQENLKLAAALQNRILEDYPTLMRPILLRNSRYNQQATTGSLLVEVGAAGNSPEEARLAAELFAQEMAELLLEPNS